MCGDFFVIVCYCEFAFCHLKNYLFRFVLNGRLSLLFGYFWAPKNALLCISVNDNQSYLEVHPKMLKNTFYTCTAGKEEYIDLEISRLETAGFENKSRETFQNKKNI